MKKNVFISFIISLVINLLCLTINLIFAFTSQTLPLSFKIQGGEIVQHFGFGILLEEFYPISSSMQSSVNINISFDFISLLIPFLIIFVIVLIFRTKLKK